MNMFTVFKKSMIEQIREYKALLLTLLSPILFMTIFGLAFGQGFYTYKIAVTNDDKGQLGQEFIKVIEEGEYSNENKIFNLNVVEYDEDKIKSEVSKQKYLAHIYIPSDFTESITGKGESEKSTNVIITGNPSNLSYSIAKTFIESFINEYEWLYTGVNKPINLKYVETQEATTKSEFEGMAPGFIVFSVFFLLILSSMVLTKEIENKTMQRLAFSKLKPWHIYAGISLSQLVLAVVMIPMVFATAYLLGFRSQGSYALAFIISIIATMSAIGIGMLIAAFCKTSLESFILGNIIITPMLFLAGIFFKVPPISLFTIGGKEIEVLTLMPTLDAVTAMNKVLLGGAGFIDVLPEIIVLVVLSIGYFLLGVMLFGKRNMKRVA